MPDGQAAHSMLYSDFNCPFCYALHERLHELNLMERIEWRGVQHAPYLPRPMTAWTGPRKVELEHEVALVRRLTPHLPISLPPWKPNTKPAIETAAAILLMDRSLGMEFIRRAYRTFWCERLDLSDATVLKSVLLQLGASTVRPTAESREMTQQWETAWRETEQSGVPLLVAPDGDMLPGCVAADELQRFFTQRRKLSPIIRPE